MCIYNALIKLKTLKKKKKKKKKKRGWGLINFIPVRRTQLHNPTNIIMHYHKNTVPYISWSMNSRFMGNLVGGML